MAMSIPPIVMSTRGRVYLVSHIVTAELSDISAYTPIRYRPGVIIGFVNPAILTAQTGAVIPAATSARMTSQVSKVAARTASADERTTSQSRARSIPVIRSRPAAGTRSRPQ